MEFIKEKFILDPTTSPFPRNKYFSPLATKYTQKPRQSYFAKYLFPQDFKSCSISPVSIKNYKELHSVSPSKCPKSYLYLKPIEILDGKTEKRLEFSVTPKLRILPIIQKSLDINACSLPKKPYKIRPFRKKSPENQIQYIMPSSTYCITEFSTLDIREANAQKIVNTQNRVPKGFRKVREMIRKQRFADAGDNTEEFSLIGWEMNTHGLTKEDSQMIIN